MKKDIETTGVAEMARSENRQAVEEIKVTPEMIEAGAVAFVGYDSRFEGPDNIVVEIFEAMINARASQEGQISSRCHKALESESAKERH